VLSGTASVGTPPKTCNSRLNIDADIPEALSGIVSNCLDRDPTARYTSIQELGQEIEVTSQTKKKTEEDNEGDRKEVDDDDC